MTYFLWPGTPKLILAALLVFLLPVLAVAVDQAVLPQEMRELSSAIAAGAPPAQMAGLLYNRANIHLKTGHPAQAEQDYTLALKLMPDLHQALANRGVARAQQGKLKQGLDDFDSALAQDPGQARYYANRGYALRRLGRLDEALAAYNRALELEPDQPAALNKRAMLLFGQGNAKPALADLDRAITLQPDNALFLCNRGQLLQALGRYEQATEQYQLAVELGGASFASRLAFRHLNWLLGALGEYEKAGQSYTQAIARFPKHHEFYASYAWRLATWPQAKARDGQKAVKLARRALALKPGAPNLDTLAAALAEAGQMDQAIKTQRRTLAAKGQSSRTAAYQERLEGYLRGEPWRQAQELRRPEWAVPPAKGRGRQPMR